MARNEPEGLGIKVYQRLAILKKKKNIPPLRRDQRQPSAIEELESGPRGV